MHDEIYKLLRATNIKKSVRKAISARSVETVTLGLVNRPFHKYKGHSKFTEEHPELWAKLQEYANWLDPDHRWTSCTINHNVQCLPHKDNRNDGTTLIIGLGDYTGGELWVDGVGDIDIREKPYYFNGYLHQHCNKAWNGDRYSLMFYSIRQSWNIVHRDEDLPIIREVYHGNQYHRKDIGFGIEKGDRWIDLGAHIGCFSKKVIYYGGTVQSYEPTPDTYKILAQNIPKEHCHNIAVTARGNPVKLTAGSKSYFVKTKPDPNGAPTLRFDTLDLDGACVKMDIEGDELEIIDTTDWSKSGIRKMVIAYHTLVDNSTKAFLDRMDLLRKTFDVYHQDMSKFGDKINIFPNEIIVYCKAR